MIDEDFLKYHTQLFMNPRCKLSTHQETTIFRKLTYIISHQSYKYNKLLAQQANIQKKQRAIRRKQIAKGRYLEYIPFDEFSRKLDIKILKKVKPNQRRRGIG